MRWTSRVIAVSTSALLVLTTAWAASPVAVGAAQRSASPSVPAQPSPTPHPAAAPAPKPNIVLITADDMRPGDLQAMKFTRNLAKRGVRFTDGISPYTLCCPARAEILTGQYSHNSGVRGNTWPNGGYWRLTGRKNTLPTWLRRAGYQTAFVGKYMNGYESKVPNCDQNWCDFLDDRRRYEIQPGWDRWYASVKRTYGYWGVTLRAKGPRPGKCAPPDGQPRLLRCKGYQTARFADIINNRIIPTFHNADDPFFIWFSSATPHTTNRGGKWAPPVPYKKTHWQRFADEPLPQGKIFQRSFNEKQMRDKTGPMTHKKKVDRRQVRNLHRHRLASLVSLDHAVKRIVTKLDRAGEWDNTVLIFTSDNGYAIGEHRLNQKDMPYESPLRVPMIISQRGLKQRYQPNAGPDTRGTSPFTVTTLDIPTTIVRLARADPGRVLEGIDMTRPKRNPDYRRGDRAVLIESGTKSKKRSPVSKFVGVRTDRWTWFGWDAKPVGDGLRFNAEGKYRRFREFYDRRDDAAQVRNIFGSGEHRDVQARLGRMTRLRFDCKGRGCVWSYDRR